MKAGAIGVVISGVSLVGTVGSAGFSVITMGGRLGIVVMGASMLV